MDATAKHEGQGALEVNGLSGAPKFLIESALHLGSENPALINVSAWSAEFARLGDLEQNDIYKALIGMDDIAGEYLSRYHVNKYGAKGSQEFNWPAYLAALKKCILVFKLLSAISPFIQEANPKANTSSRYDYYVEKYEGIISGYESVMATRAATSRKVESTQMEEVVN